MDNLNDEAKKLASRPYMTVVLRDETTEGELIYVAMNQELPGCIAQGDTPDEARHNLDETRVDFVLHLLENQLHVPEPQPISNAVIDANTDFETISHDEKSIPDLLLKT